MVKISPAGLVGAVHERVVLGRRAEVLAGAVARMVPGPGRLLDIGSGDGRIAARLAALRPDLAVEAVELRPRPGAALPVAEFDGRRLPFPDGGVDYASLIDVLHHAEDPAALLAEAARVARLGVVVKDHLREGAMAGPVLALMDRIGNRGRGVALPHAYLDRAEWDALFARLGLGVGAWRGRLGLYGFPLAPVFERGLHFLALLVPQACEHDQINGLSMRAQSANLRPN